MKFSACSTVQTEVWVVQEAQFKASGVVQTVGLITFPLYSASFPFSPRLHFYLDNGVFVWSVGKAEVSFAWSVPAWQSV